ncbi:hypothetical protein TNCV_4246141 [Trichonephila clavipes]|nr:hypothetical protein TNCV_4246141 [Trichonephila clavipes]
MFTQTEKPNESNAFKAEQRDRGRSCGLSLALYPKVAGSTPPKSVDFHYAENRLWSYRMTKQRHVKDPMRVYFASVFSKKIKIEVWFRIARAQVSPSREETGRQNYLQRLVSTNSTASFIRINWDRTRFGHVIVPKTECDS